MPFEGTPGPRNAITDVAGVEVGQVSLVSGQGKLVVGKGPVRTGVTAVHPRGKADPTPVLAGFSTFNGNGEMSGAAFVEETGVLETPVLMTNTHSVGVVRDAVVAWGNQARTDRPGLPGLPDRESWLPLVGETQDDALNDILGFHVKKEHVFQALDQATSGPVAEGNVGAGVGGMTFMFKSGMGTASRVLPQDKGGYTVGVLLQSNFGWDHRESLLIAGLPVGREIPDLAPVLALGERPLHGEGSLCCVVATDAPLLPHQLKRLARRVALGMARVGSKAHNGSGEFFLAFSTASPEAGQTTGPRPVSMLPNQKIDALFDAVVEATEEAIVNSLVAARTMEGVDGNVAYALPHDRLRAVLAKYNRLEK